MKAKINVGTKQVVTFATCFFAFLLIWILAIPFVRHFYKTVPKYVRWALLCVAVFAMNAIGFSFTVWFALIPILALEAHAQIGFIWQKGHGAFKQMSKTLVLLLTMLLHIAIALLIRMVFPEAWEQELSTWVTKIGEYLQQTANRSPEASASLISRWKELHQYIPAFYFSAFLMAYLVSFWGTSLLNKIEIPSLYFWSILLSFCLAFIDLKGLKVTLPPEVVLTAKNVFFPLCCLYFFQGVAVLNSLFDKIKIARFWRNMWYILIILYMPVGLVLLGVAEYLFDYREKYKEERKGLE